MKEIAERNGTYHILSKIIEKNDISEQVNVPKKKGWMFFN